MRTTRRSFLRASSGLVAATAIPRGAEGAAYRVGIGRESDPYAATVRAIDASSGWLRERIFGKTVVIKPNLVSAMTADSGVTTDPEVVRAIVDRALGDGAAEVLIVEASPQGAWFSPCGYDGFGTYGPRVRLVDLAQQPLVLAPTPLRLAYDAVFVAPALIASDVFFVSAAKLKTHGDAIATLAMKNLFGLPAIDRYISSPAVGRFAMHDRSVHQTIVDLNALRPVDFAVVDGIVGMEGNGPLSGTPVRMDTVIAGANACAVDRVALIAMGLPQRLVRHLDLAAAHGLGPADVSSIEIAGDALEPRAFAWPPVPPIIEHPRVWPASFNPAASQTVQIFGWYRHTCVRKLEVLRLYDDTPQVDLVKTLIPSGVRQAGVERALWDGRGDDGVVVSPGRYGVHVRAVHASLQGRPSDAIGWVTVV